MGRIAGKPTTTAAAHGGTTPGSTAPGSPGCFRCHSGSIRDRLPPAGKLPGAADSTLPFMAAARHGPEIGSAASESLGDQVKRRQAADLDLPRGIAGG